MANVKLILREDVPNLGDPGDVISVKPGYARNFLVPQGKAIPATDARVKELEHHKRVVAEKVARELKALHVVVKQLESLELQINAKAGEEGKLFGSVTTAQIAELLVEKGFPVDRRKVLLDDPIKEVGEHTVPLKLHAGLVANLKLVVAAEE